MEPIQVPAGSAVITPTELYKEMQATHQSVTELRGEVKEIAKVLPDHESRIRVLERKVWVAAGVAAGAAAGLTKALSTVLGG